MLDKIKAEPYQPEPKVQQEIMNWYKVLQEDFNIKSDTYRHLGHQTLTRFWEVARDNYDVVVPLKSKRDWKRKVKSALTRDKANGFIAKLVARTIEPQIIAQNNQQDIDNVVSRAFRGLLFWWQWVTKSVRVFNDAVQMAVIEGTVHVQVDVINGIEEKSIIPNEEVFVPNLFQPDVQKQSHFIRAQVTTYIEAKLVWGDHDNWKFVHPGTSAQWAFTPGNLQTDLADGMLKEDEVQIIYGWKHKGWDKKGFPKQKERIVLINGVMFTEIAEKMPFDHNKYPVAKTVFEKFSRVKFYWGNSLGNKLKQNQAWEDAWKTIVLNKGILNMLPPLLDKSGEHVDDDVIVPAKITPTQSEKGDIFKIEGVADPVSPGDVALLEQMVTQEADRSSLSKASLGQTEKGQQTLGEIQLKDARSSELLTAFGQLMSFLVEDLAELSISNIIQFMIRKDVEKVIEGDVLYDNKIFNIPEQSLDRGEFGTLSVNFTPTAQQPTSLQTAQMEADTKKKTGVSKQLIFIDPEYIKQFKFFFRIVANPVTRPSEALERLMTLENYKVVYFNNPHIDQREATRDAIRANQDDEDRLLAKAPAPAELALQQGGQATRTTQPTQRAKQALTSNRQTV